MAMLVKDETARRLTDLLARAGGRGVSNPRDPRDLSGGGNDFIYTRFRLDITGSLTAKVNAGSLYVNGGYVDGGGPAPVPSYKFTKVDTTITGVGFDIGGGTWSKQADFATSTTYYVYLELAADYNNPALGAAVKDEADYNASASGAVLRIVCDDSWPADQTWHRQIWILGSFYVADGAIVESTLARNWIGDIDLAHVIPDTHWLPLADYRTQTLEYDVTDTIGALEIKNSHSANLADGGAWIGRNGICGLFKQAGQSNPVLWYGVDAECPTAAVAKSIEITSALIRLYNIDEPDTDATSPSVVCRTDTNGTGNITYFDIISLVTNYLGTDGSGGIGDGIGDWLNTNQIINHYDLNFTDKASTGNKPAIGAGASQGNTDHDDSYWHAYNDGSGSSGHTAFVDSKAYHTSNAAVAGLGVGALVLTEGGLYAKGGVYANGTGVDGAGNFITGSFWARIASPTEAARLTDGSNIVYIADGTRAIDVTSGSYHHESHGGASYTAGKLRIPTDGGGYIECYLRGGILTTT